MIWVCLNQNVKLKQTNTLRVKLNIIFLEKLRLNYINNWRCSSYVESSTSYLIMGLYMLCSLELKTFRNDLKNVLSLELCNMKLQVANNCLLLHTIGMDIEIA